MEFEIRVPHGYKMVETDQVVASESVVIYTHLFGFLARRHAEQLNASRTGPLFRYVAEPAPKELRRKLGWLNRWAVVPYQNVLRPVGTDNGR